MTEVYVTFCKEKGITGRYDNKADALANKKNNEVVSKAKITMHKDLGRQYAYPSANFNA